MNINNAGARPQLARRGEGAPKTRDKMDGSAIRCHVLLLTLLLASCAAPDTRHQIVVSTREQKLALVDRGKVLAIYPVSTSKFGLGDWRGSRFTPLGKLQIVQKVGDNAPPGAVFKDRRRTGEVVAPDSPGRDPIVTRILWLRGLEAQNANAFSRDIYIHGTPEERRIGTPASYGCIRMRSSDIIQLYDIVGTGAAVTIVTAPLAAAVPSLVSAHSMADTNPAPFVMR
jgi:lipoprotein-anchoring transpeptidase ErfK/SrfK